MVLLFLQASILYEFDLLDQLVDLLIKELTRCSNDMETIPVLAMLREVYITIRHRFEPYQFNVEDDRVLSRIASVEARLDHIYHIKPKKME